MFAEDDPGKNESVEVNESENCSLSDCLLREHEKVNEKCQTKSEYTKTESQVSKPGKWKQ